MSANNQTLVKEHNGKWYVFTNIQAESWVTLDENDKVIEGRENELSIKEAAAVCNTKEEAFEKAAELDQDDEYGGTEYGVQLNRLCKDDAEVKLLDDERSRSDVLPSPEPPKCGHVGTVLCKICDPTGEIGKKYLGIQMVPEPEDWERQLLERWRSMDWLWTDPRRMGGAECISGTRLPIRLFLADIKTLLEKERSRFPKVWKDMNEQRKIGRNEGREMLLEELREKIKNLPPFDENHNEKRLSYEAARNDILALLDSKEKKGR